MKNKKMFSLLVAAVLFVSGTAYSGPQTDNSQLAPQSVRAGVGQPQAVAEMQVIEKIAPDSEKFPVNRPFLCPNPPLTITEIHQLPYVSRHNPADFPPSWSSFPLTGYNGTLPNKFFLDTFAWKTRPCCQFISGTLTIYYQPIQGGHGDNSSQAGDAGNDSWFIYKNGTAQAGGFLYSATTPPYKFAAGSGPYTKVINLTAAMVDCNRLSFGVQDDTKVIWAKINLTYCCVTEGCGKN